MLCHVCVDVNLLVSGHIELLFLMFVTVCMSLNVLDKWAWTEAKKNKERRKNRGKTQGNESKAKRKKEQDNIRNEKGSAQNSHMI